MNFDQAVNIEDLHQMAKRKLPKIMFDYIEGGVEDERGLARNDGGVPEAPSVAALPGRCVEARPDADAVRPHLCEPVRHLADRRRRASTSGAAANCCWPRRRPTRTSPTSCRAAATPRWKKPREVAPDNTWFQMYAAKDAGVTDALVGRARDNGLGALVLTVDVPVHPKRERNYRNGFANVRGGGVLERR